MMLSVRYLALALALVSFVNGGVIYRGTERRAVDEAARHGLQPRQADSSSSASDSASSAAPTGSSSAGSSSGSAAAPGASSSASSSAPKFSYGKPKHDYPGVQATGPNGPTNPKEPKLDTPINQTSMSRLASLNSVDDWCTFGPPDNTQPLGNVEAEVVAWCTKPRNNARVIPDGTVTSAHFVKTPLYVQVMARGDFTKIGFQANDTGGELDPHGATGKGNPIGGNVTSNVTGKDVFYQEWMNYVGHDILCFRVCIAGSDQAEPKSECQHTLDEMGCWSIMPGDYTDNVFDSCEADAAYPPGIYVSGGSTSSFQQYATGLWTDNGKEKTYTNGVSTQTTPTTAMSTPSSSNCKTASSIANGIKSIVPPPAPSPADGGDAPAPDAPKPDAPAPADDAPKSDAPAPADDAPKSDAPAPAPSS